jgi:hypothetical protein
VEWLETRLTPVISGQWASQVVAFSSQYSDTTASAAQALGEPDTPLYGGSATAWAPLPANSGGDFDAAEHLTLRFANAVTATGVQIRETLGPGFVKQVDFLFIDDQGAIETIVTRPANDPGVPDLVNLFGVIIPPTTSPVNAVTIHVDIDRDSGWEQIDAVKLLDGVFDPNSGPSDIALSNSTADEDAGYSVVGTLSATDPSPNETFRYELVGGALDFFYLSGGKLVTAFPWQFRAGSSYLVVIRAIDSDGLSFDKTFTINIADLNDAPSGTDAAIAVARNTPYTFSGAEFGFSDHGDEVPNQPLNLIIAGVSGVGALTLAGVPVAADQVIPWSDLGSVVYTPPSELIGSLMNFTFKVQDDGGAPEGGGRDIDSTPNTMTFQVGLEGISGQWAHRLVNFSTEYTATSWSARQVLGAPDTPVYGDSVHAWAPLPGNSGGKFDAHEHVTVRFRNPVHAVGALVRETLGNGFVERVDFLFINRKGRVRLVHQWTGVDPSQPGAASDFIVSIPKTASLVNAVRVHVNIDHDSYWEEIDAIRLLDVNQAPTDIKLSNHVARPGSTVVGVLTALDPDAGEKFTFRLVGGATQHFRIVGNTLQTSASFKAAPRTLSLRIRATDRGGRFIEETFKIEVKDNAGFLASRLGRRLSHELSPPPQIL